MAPSTCPKVSIIIPVYNTGESAVRLVRTLLHDPYQNLELLVVDDASTDRSLALLRAIPHDPRLFILSKQVNGGSGAAARNYALKKATGDYIAFIDSDDSVARQFLTSLSRALQQPRTLLAVTGFQYRRLRQGTTRDAFITPLSPRHSAESYREYILRLLATDGRLYSSVNKLYRADVIRRHHLRFDERLDFAEDTKFVLDYLNYAPLDHPDADQFAFVLKPYYIYNYGTATSTVARSSLPWTNWQKSFQNLQHWLGPHPTRRELRQLRKVHFRWKISHGLAVARSDQSFRQKSRYLHPLLLPIFILLAKIRH